MKQPAAHTVSITRRAASLAPVEPLKPRGTPSPEATCRIPARTDQVPAVPRLG
ncbi:hypothetical protein [Streptomyces variegatus]|uniref:hypothetical protein n=1 Tax=Streptomyces variegatus TaxID=284040 RepID=UPI003C2FAC86